MFAFSGHTNSLSIVNARDFQPIDFLVFINFNSSFQENKKTRLTAIREACWKLKEYTKKEQNGLVDK